jgi:hypothetical protein
MGSLSNGGRRVVVTGLGLVTPLGIGLKDNWSNLIAGKCSIKPLDSEGILQISYFVLKSILDLGICTLFFFSIFRFGLGKCGYGPEPKPKLVNIFVIKPKPKKPEFNKFDCITRKY